MGRRDRDNRDCRDMGEDKEEEEEEDREEDRDRDCRDKGHRDRGRKGRGHHSHNHNHRNHRNQRCCPALSSSRLLAPVRWRRSDCCCCPPMASVGHNPDQLLKDPCFPAANQWPPGRRQSRLTFGWLPLRQKFVVFHRSRRRSVRTTAVKST